MAEQENLEPGGAGRAEELAKRALALSARAEELAREAHAVAGVDEQLAALEAELDALAREEAALDASLAGDTIESGWGGSSGAGSSSGVGSSSGAGSSSGDDEGFGSPRSGGDARFAGGDARFAGGDARFAGGDARFAGGDATSAGGNGQEDWGDWAEWAESFSRRMELLGDRVGALVAGHLDAAWRTSGTAAGGSSSGELSLDATGIGRVLVRNRGGSIVVRPGSASRIEVRWRGRRRPDPDGAVTSRIEDGTLVVESAPRYLVGRGLRLDLTVPPGIELDLTTGGGAVVVGGIGGPARVRTGGGSVTLTDIKGAVDAFTGGGSVSFRGRPSGQSALRTGGGSITVVLDSDTDIDVEASGTPSIIDVAGTRVKRYGVVSGRVGAGGGRLVAHSGGGSVRITQGG